MLQIKGITDVKAEKFYEAASKIESGGYLTATVIEERRKKIKKISTGAPQFDMLLGKFKYVTHHKEVELRANLSQKPLVNSVLARLNSRTLFV